MTKNRLIITGAVLLLAYAAVMVLYEAQAQEPETKNIITVNATSCELKQLMKNYNMVHIDDEHSSHDHILLKIEQ